MFSQLVTALYDEGDSVRTLEVLDFAEKMIPGSTVRHDYVSTTFADYYYKLGETQKGDAIMDVVAQDCVENLNWYASLTGSQLRSVGNRLSHNMAVLNQVLSMCDQAGRKELVDKYLPTYMKYNRRPE
jgi:hypothetical protein